MSLLLNLGVCPQNQEHVKAQFLQKESLEVIFISC